LLWFVQVNRVGGESHWPGFGGSQLANPSGKVLSRGALDKEGIFYGDIDTREVMTRRSSTYWFDRRPEVYEKITSILP
jgi:predicted amidohydrolase